MSYRPPKKGKKAKSSNLGDDEPVYEPIISSSQKLKDPETMDSPEKTSNLISPTSEKKELTTPNTEAGSTVNESLFDSFAPPNLRIQVNPPTENKVLEEPISRPPESDQEQSQPDAEDQTDLKTPEKSSQQHMETEEFGSSAAHPQILDSDVIAQTKSYLETPVQNVEVQNTSQTNHDNSHEEFEKKSQLSDPPLTRQDSGSFMGKLNDLSSSISETLAYKTAYYSLLKLKVGYQLFTRNLTTA